jgi:C-terminal processing protease CtpA/Prc
VQKPLGALLEEDKNGDVFITEVQPGSNAARAGLVAGERISMVSATFGNELWSVNGAGLGRVQKAIQVRVGTTVKLVVQNEKEKKKVAKAATMSADEKAERFLAEQSKRDTLLKQLNTEAKDAAKGGFGLFKKNFGIWGNDEPK